MGLTLHISMHFHARIRFALCRVLSPVLTASLLISFPVGTKMLQFPPFPIADAIELKFRKSYSAILGSKAPCAYPRHIAAWHDLRRHLSQAIPQMVWRSLTQLHTNGVVASSATRVISDRGLNTSVSVDMNSFRSLAEASNRSLNRDRGEYPLVRTPRFYQTYLL